VEGWHNVFPTVVSLLLDEVPMGDNLAFVVVGSGAAANHTSSQRLGH